MENLYPIGDLFDHLNSVDPIGDNFKNLLPQNMLPIDGPFDLNTILLKEGEVSEIAYWMPVGYARGYREVPGQFPDEKKQQTIKFWKRGLVVIKDSFFKQVPSSHCLEFSKDAVLRGIHFDQLQVMKQQTTEANELIGKILSDDYAEVFDRAMLLRLPCMERYQLFLDYFHPRIEQYFELRHIASYLGMDPTTLAILRNKRRGR